MQSNIRQATRSLRRYARRRVRRYPDRPFEHLTRWVRTNPTEQTIMVLEQVLQKKLHFELRRWTGRMLAELARKGLTQPEDVHDASPKP